MPQKEQSELNSVLSFADKLDAPARIRGTDMKQI